MLCLFFALTFIVHMRKNKWGRAFFPPHNSAVFLKAALKQRREKTTKDDKSEYPGASVFRGELLLPQCHTESFPSAESPRHPLLL